MARDTLPGKGKDAPKIPYSAFDEKTSGSGPGSDDTVLLDWELDDEGVKIYRPDKNKNQEPERWSDDAAYDDEGVFREEYGDYTYEESYDQSYPPVSDDNWEDGEGKYYPDEDYDDPAYDDEGDFYEDPGFAQEGGNKKKIGALVGLAVFALIVFLAFRWQSGKPKSLVRGDISSEKPAQEAVPEESRIEEPQVVWASEEASEDDAQESATSHEAGHLEEPKRDPSPGGRRELVIHYPNQSLDQESQGSGASSNNSGQEEESRKPDPDKLMAKGNRLLSQNAQKQEARSNLPLNHAQAGHLPFALDFSRDPDLSRQVLVHAREDGYDLYSRHEASFQGMDLADLTGRLAQEEEGTTFPSKVSVRLVSKEEAESIASDPDLESRVETGSGADSDMRWVFYRNRDQGAIMDKLSAAMETPAMTPDRLAQLVTQETGEAQEDEPLDPDDEWDRLTDRLSRDAFGVEWKYNLPLYAAGPFERLGIPDLRARKPGLEPAYETGLVDLDGDGHPEYLIHASMRGESQEGIQGYWAVLTPSKSGLLVQAVYPYGNGDMIFKKDGPVLTSQSKEGDHVTFSIYKSAYPAPGGELRRLTFYHPQGLGESLTYEDMKDSFEGAYLIPHKDQLYLASREDYDAAMNLAQNAIQGGIQLALSGGPGADTGIKDVNKYLLQNFQELPLSPSAWSKAVPLANFEDWDEPIRYEDIASEG